VAQDERFRHESGEAILSAEGRFNFQETVCGSSRLYSLTAATTLTELFDEWWKAILIGIVLAALLAARLSTLA
jgi:hypothetical protein